MKSNDMSCKYVYDDHTYNYVSVSSFGGRYLTMCRKYHGTADVISIIDFLKRVEENNRNKAVEKGEKTMSKEMLKNLGVSKVIFNGKTTIVFLEDGTKGVAQCGTLDSNDPLVGFSIAYTLAKATKGNKRQFKENIQFMTSKAKNGKFEVK